MVYIRYSVPPKPLPRQGYKPTPFPWCALNTPVKDYWSYRSISICEVKAITVFRLFWKIWYIWLINSKNYVLLQNIKFPI